MTTPACAAPLELTPADLEQVDRALAEDLGAGDVTTVALVRTDCHADALLLARTSCVVAGLALAEAVFQKLDPAATVERRVPDGAVAQAGETIAVVRASARAILSGERTALNFLQRLSGIATLTRRFVDRAAGRLIVLDTRKTTPTFRRLEKYAVRCGGGVNHRTGLFDMAMIKDNHRALWSIEGAEGLAGAVARIRTQFPGVPVEVEVESEPELREALEANPDWVLLDNMRPEDMRRCVAIAAGRCRLEASGGVTLESIEAIAACGVNAVSIGALTHSAPAADLSLEFHLCADDAP